MVNTTSPLEQNVVVVIDLEEQPEDLDFPYPADQLPDLPPVEPDQVLNNNPQLNQPNPQPISSKSATTSSHRTSKSTKASPQNPPTYPPHQPYQPNPPPNQPPNLPSKSSRSSG